MLGIFTTERPEELWMYQITKVVQVYSARQLLYSSTLVSQTNFTISIMFLFIYHYSQSITHDLLYHCHKRSFRNFENKVLLLL